MLRVGRSLGRSTLRGWGRLEVVPGYLYRAIDRCGPSLAGSTLLPSQMPNGCIVTCDLHDEVQRQMWFYGVYEPISAYLFKQLLRPGMIVVDAGANVGQYSLLASTCVGNDGEVHSFEPVPSNFARLMNHVEQNRLTNIRPNQKALWHKNENVILRMPSGMSNNEGAYSVRTRSTLKAGIEAEAVRLDRYFDTYPLNRVNVIKMDIEGSEPFAINGALNIIKRWKPVILAEVNRAALKGLGSSNEELWELVSGMGYKAWRIGSSPETSGPTFDLRDFVQSNAFFYHDDLPPGIRSGWSYKAALRWARSML